MLSPVTSHRRHPRSGCSPRSTISRANASLPPPPPPPPLAPSSPPLDRTGVCSSGLLSSSAAATSSFGGDARALGSSGLHSVVTWPGPTKTVAA